MSSDLTIRVLLSLVTEQGNNLLGYEFEDLFTMIGLIDIDQATILRCRCAFECLPEDVSFDDILVQNRIVSVENLRRVLLIASMLPETFDMADFD